MYNNPPRGRKELVYARVLNNQSLVILLYLVQEITLKPVSRALGL